MHKPKIGPFFFCGFISNFFCHFFCFPFLLPFFSLYLLPFIPFLSTGRVLASALLKTWKLNIDQPGGLTYFTTIFAPKIGHVFFWYSSARIWLIFKMDTRMDGSVLAVLAAYQNNLVTSKLMTLQVVQCLWVENVPKIRPLVGKSQGLTLPYHSPYISCGTSWENLSKYQGILPLVITFFILIT